MNIKVGIIDYYTCNILSVYNSILNLGYNPGIINNKNDIKKFDKIIIPGVGSANKTMSYFFQNGFYDEILEFNLKKKNILGICLGMQILAKKLLENGETSGFDFFDSIVEPLISLKDKKFNINIGWRNIKLINNNNNFFDFIENKKIYFCHSYYMNFRNKKDKCIIGVSNDQFNIPTLIIKNNIWGIQGHPEKSQKVGKVFLQKFLEIDNG